MVPDHIALKGIEVILMPQITVFLGADNVESMNAINVLSLARLCFLLQRADKRL